MILHAINNALAMIFANWGHKAEPWYSWNGHVHPIIPLLAIGFDISRIHSIRQCRKKIFHSVGANVMNAMQNNRSEMLHAEVNVLLDTFRRLLRRRARTNLEKLTIKTHPADLALLFRHFSDEERQQVFTVIQKTETVGEFLPELDESIVEALLGTSRCQCGGNPSGESKC
jgi:hypothetical protein